MGQLIMVFIRGLITFGAGLGAAKVLDKVAADKLPAGSYPAFPFYKDTTGAINWTKVIVFMVIGAVSILLVKFIGKKLNVKLLK